MTLVFLRSLLLWLHLVSVTAWVGGILFFLFVFGPAVHGLPPAPAIQVLNKGRKLFESLSWIAIHISFLTGLATFFLRAGATEPLFAVGYNSILALKLFLFLAMLFHHSLQTWKYGPQLTALTTQASPDAQSWPEPLLSRWKKWFMLLKINAVLGLIVLLLGLGLNRSWM